MYALLLLMSLLAATSVTLCDLEKAGHFCVVAFLWTCSVAGCAVIYPAVRSIIRQLCSQQTETSAVQHACVSSLFPLIFRDYLKPLAPYKYVFFLSEIMHTEAKFCSLVSLCCIISMTSPLQTLGSYT